MGGRRVVGKGQRIRRLVSRIRSMLRAWRKPFGASILVRSLFHRNPRTGSTGRKPRPRPARGPWTALDDPLPAVPTDSEHGPRGPIQVVWVHVAPPSFAPGGASQFVPPGQRAPRSPQADSTDGNDDAFSFPDDPDSDEDWDAVWGDVFGAFENDGLEEGELRPPAGPQGRSERPPLSPDFVDADEARKFRELPPIEPREIREVDWRSLESRLREEPEDAP